MIENQVCLVATIAGWLGKVELCRQGKRVEFSDHFHIDRKSIPAIQIVQ
jgi:hypothetical protein